MKIKETKKVAPEFGGDGIPVTFTRVVEVEALPEGVTALPDDTPVTDWEVEK